MTNQNSTPKTSRETAGRPSLRWMRDAACTTTPGLPWIGPRRGQTIPPGVLEAMADTCTACPVQAACADFAADTGATAGFWAGQWHHPHPTQTIVGRDQTAGTAAA